MANDTVEFDVLINGKKAKTSLKDIKKELDNLEKKDNETATRMKADWVKIGAAVAVAGVALVKITTSALALEKATFGLTDATKKYIKQTSELHGMTQEVVAGFVQTGKAAGMSGKEIETMIEQAVALGRKFPHESTETFIDNLSMLNRTGEAQGFIVDVLETKYGTLDLKSLSLAQKMAAIEETTKGVNDEFNKTRAAKVDKIIQEITNSTTDLGTSLLNMLDSSGALYLFNKGVNAVSLGMNGLALTAKQAKIWVKDLFGADTTEDLKEFNNLLKENENLWKEIADAQKIEKPKPETITGIEGTEKPKTQLELELEIKKQAELKKIREKASDEEFAEIDAEFKEMEDAYDKHQKEILDLRNSFNDDYIKSITEPHEFELVQLSEKYNEYAKYVKDKAKLDEWYNAEVEKILKDDEKALEKLSDFHENVMTGMADSVVQFAQTGKLSFKDFANSIIADIIRMNVKSAATSMFGAIGGAGGISSILGSIGSFFHAGTDEVKHMGGLVGGGANIPSHHNGNTLRTDERIAKLQVGEAVVNRAGATNNKNAINAMNRGEKIGAGNGDTFVNDKEVVNNHTTIMHEWKVSTPDATTFVSQLVQNRDTIEGIVNSSLVKNGSIRQTIKTVI